MGAHTSIDDFNEHERLRAKREWASVREPEPGGRGDGEERNTDDLTQSAAGERAARQTTYGDGDGRDGARRRGVDMEIRTVAEVVAEAVKDWRTRWSWFNRHDVLDDLMQTALIRSISRAVEAEMEKLFLDEIAILEEQRDELATKMAILESRGDRSKIDLAYELAAAEAIIWQLVRRAGGRISLDKEAVFSQDDRVLSIEQDTPDGKMVISATTAVPEDVP